MSARAWTRGLYAITSEAICRDEETLLARVRDALEGGAVLLQYRDKHATPDLRELRARRLLALCHSYDVPLIVNDDAPLAARIGADGVHLGRADTPLAEARQLLGPRAIIGVSCGSELARAQAAAAAGASYVAFGRFFPSRTKPDALPATLEVLSAAGRALALPVCAIGGVTPLNMCELIAHGADLVAAVEGVFGAPDVRSAAQAYTLQFAQIPPLAARRGSIP